MTIIDFASKHGFESVELRGLQQQKDLTERPEFQAGRIGETKKMLADRGLRVSCLGASALMHEAEPAVRDAQMAEARRFIDLAAGLGAPYVRVFGDKLDPARREEVLQRVTSGPRELGRHAQDRGVTVLMESHGDFVDSPTLNEVPVKRQVQLLTKSGYKGDYSFEWEKRWHPEIPEPDVAIPHFARVVRECLASA
jgi:sugar phosphate isomerase/epimerase